MSPWCASGLGLVPRLDALRAVEGELLLLGLPLSADGVEEEGVVAAGDEALDDPPDEPVRQAGDDRDPLRPLVPLAPLELVDLVAGLPAEQLGDLLAVRRDEVHAEVLGALGDLEGVVLVRQPGQEARRVDADLRREADEAARALPVVRHRRDDEHRVVELAHERGERLDDVVGGGHVRESYPLCRSSRRSPPRRVSRPGRIAAAAGAAAAGLAAAGIARRGLWPGPRSERRGGAELGLPAWPAALDGLRVALVSDLHAGAPHMGEERIARVVASVRDQRPDLVLLLGASVADEVHFGSAVSPEAVAGRLAALEAPRGVLAVLGNHDWRHDGPRVAGALRAAGIPVLENDAVRAGEGLWVAGVADSRHRRPDVA